MVDILKTGERKKAGAKHLPQIFALMLADVAIGESTNNETK